jgi:hypothetical protein
MASIFRVLSLLLGGGFLVCMVLFAVTKDPIWRHRGVFILKWGVVLGLVFFGLLILRRAAVFI